MIKIQTRKQKVFSLSSPFLLNSLKKLKMVPSRTEPFTRLFFLQGCRNRLNFAASIIDTTSRLMLQMLCGGN